MSLRKWLILPIVVVFAALIAWGSFFNLGTYFIAPGQTQNVARIIQLQGVNARTYPGKILMTDVTLGPLTPFEWAIDHLNSKIDYVPSSEIVGSASTKTFTSSQLSQMESAKLTATVAALRYAGQKVRAVKGAYVVAVVPGTPADGKLQAGDIIAAVNGNLTPTISKFQKVFSTLKSGQTVSLEVLRQVGGTRNPLVKNISVELAKDPQQKSKPLLGIEFDSGSAYFLPTTVSISTGQIGGPSAGLAFALGILQKLGVVTVPKGEVVAATGTMSSQGQVGDVGGVRQKTFTVIAGGAKVFLVPPQEYKVALAANAGRIRVVEVSSLAQAVQTLEKLP